MNWAHIGPALLASFLASLVEFVEALTIVLAVGVVRGWRSAIAGTLGGVLLLTLLVLLFGPALQRIPLHSLQLVIGVLLLLFGIRWLRKAVLRAGGKLSLHDEAKIFEREKNKLSGQTAQKSALDSIAVATTFKAVTLEGLEVVFIVIATSAGGMLLPAVYGASAAGLLVILLGMVVHKPLTRVPENTLKYVVGVILTAFGTFWIGEGAGMHWPGSDIALLALGAGYLLASWAGVYLTRKALQTPPPSQTKQPAG